jgi:NDP-sugar pyrophosphorylase family protein
MKHKISITINDKILRDVDSFVDNVFISNRSQAIEYLVEKSLDKNKVAVILAGSGKKDSKKINDRFALKIFHLTIIEKAIKNLSDNGFNKIYVVADHKTLTKIFNITGDGSDKNIKIEFVEEENILGSASALKLLHNKIKSTFLVVQSDIIFDGTDINELWKQHFQAKDVMTMRVCSSIIPSNEFKFGRVFLQGNKITSYVERPEKTGLISSIFFGGLFVAEPSVFSYYGNSLENDVFPELAKKGLLGGQMSNTEHLHIHTKADLAYVRKKLKLYIS